MLYYIEYVNNLEDICLRGVFNQTDLLNRGKHEKNLLSG